MTHCRSLRAGLVIFLAAFLAVSPTHALVTLNDGRDKIFVNATVAIGYDSNIFANSDSHGDATYSTFLNMEYTRRAGWIGVNAQASVASTRFGSTEEQNFDNPNFSVELTKQTGRTTGSFTASASRESRADATVNTRSTAWVVPLGLNFKYPINGVYTLAGSLAYSSREYLDETYFASLQSYSGSVDLLRIMTTERDLLVGYRYRYHETSRRTSSTDHNVSVGINGKIVRGVAGGLRVGYQERTPHGPGRTQEKISSWTISGPASFAISKRLNLYGTIAKDLAITATDAYVDTTTFTLDSKYAFTSRWSTVGSATVGDTRFLGENGRMVLDAGPPPVLGANRHDRYLTWSWTLHYSRNERLKASLAYSWFKNWSTLGYADFVRSAWTLTLSTRW